MSGDSLADGAPTVERIERGGSRAAILLTPSGLDAAVMALSPARDLVLSLRGAHPVGGRYELSVTPVRDDGMVVCFRQDCVVRWLARGDDETPIADGDGHPAKLLVPRTWASSALRLAVLTAELPRTLPWHDARFASLGALPLDEVSFARCVADPHACVVVLARRIAAHVVGSADPESAADDVIAELRRVGHDLWSLDAGADQEIWGSDYMRVADGQGLYLEFGTRGVCVQFGDARADAP